YQEKITLSDNMTITNVTVQNVKTIVKERGTGQPVLFIHGNPDSADMWDSVIARLPDGYRYLAPDMPGFGRSQTPRDFDYSLANRGYWVWDLLIALNITDPVFLVVHDHGGPFGITFAVQQPYQVQGVIVMNTLYNRDYVWHPMGKIWRTPILGEIFAYLQILPTSFPIMYAYMKWGSPKITIGHVWRLYKYFRPQTMRHMLRLYRASDPEVFIEYDEKWLDFVWQQPVHILWGERDRYLPITIAEKMVAAGATLTRYPEHGHWLAIENPAAVADEIAAFLAKFTPKSHM
ncbi:MAG: alpha/beta fold hydrolase, partial [Aggregatilineales bacterium]